MARHGVARESQRPKASVEFDVKHLRSRFPAAGTRPGDDARSQVVIRVPELPQPLRFDFIRYLVFDEETDEEKPVLVGEEFVLVGFAIERAVTLEEGNERPESVELTQAQLATLWENFHAYRRLAEEMAYPVSPAKGAAAVRTAMRRRQKWDAWTDDDLALLVAEYRGFRGVRGAISTLAEARGVSRQTISGALRLAVERGLISESELPKRRQRVARAE